MSKRVRALQIFFLVWSIVIIGRLTYWQIFKSSQLKDEASSQYFRTTQIPSSRGEIVSADGFPLVSNQENYLVYVNLAASPSGQALSQLANTLPASSSAKFLIQEAKVNSLSWIVLDHNLPATLKKAISDQKIPGVGFEAEPNRIYPEGSPSAYLSGFVGKDASGNPRGYFGLEGYYDRELSGKPGKLLQEKDAFGRPIVIGGFNRIPPQNGRSLATSIDRTVQFIAYQKLSAGLKKYQSISGTVSIMDSSSGQILAMVAIPGYDPASYTEFSPNLYRNPIVSEFYEPGSTFKTIVMASALDAKAITTATVCDICSGSAIYSGMKVSSWDGKYYPNSSMSDIILHSDNVGMTFVGQKLGKEKLLSYIKKFGIGRLTGIDLQEESTPELRPDSEWVDIDYATATFGQGIAITPIQLLTAVNAIANHGVLVSPRIVNQIVSPEGVKKPSFPKPVTVISPLAAAQTTEMMINGVNNGAASAYKPKGYLIAGKSGTAQVPISGHYDTNNVVSSFIGFAPADDPKFTMLVTLHQTNSTDWGSTTAAPIWFSIASELFRYFNISPKL